MVGGFRQARTAPGPQFPAVRASPQFGARRRAQEEFSYEGLIRHPEHGPGSIIQTDERNPVQVPEDESRSAIDR
jgi:hypothetical protein